MVSAESLYKGVSFSRLADKILSSLIEDIIIIYDRDGTYLNIWIGPVLETRYGITADELIGKKIDYFSTCEIAEKRREKLREIFETGTQFREEYQIELPGGNFWHDIVLSPLHDEDGSVIAVVGCIRDITKLHETEYALRQNEERSRSLIENIPIGVFRTTPDGRILYANKGIANLLGFDSPEELANVNLEKKNYFGDFTRKKFREIIEKEGSVAGLESSWRRQDGKIIYIRENAVAVQDDSGKTLYYEGTIEDVTDRKEMEDALRQGREEYLNLIERAYDGITVIQDGVLKYLNPRLGEIIGYTTAELEGTSFPQYIHPSFRDQVVDNYSKRMKGEFVPPVYESALIHKQGQKIDVEINGGIIVFEGAPADFVYIRDITERKRAEREMIESERKYRVLFENSTEAILLLNLDGEILDADRKACKLFGFSKGELLQMDIAKLFPEEVYETEIHPKLKELFELDYMTESFVQDKSGDSVPVEFAMKKVTIGGENRILAIFQNITRRFNLERQLRRSQRLEAVGQLAGGVAHDFNNILTALFGYTDILKFALENNSELIGYVDEIEKVASKASALTQQLLTFSRKQVLAPVILDLNFVVREMTGMLDRLIGENIEFIQELGEALPLISVDRGGLEQVVMNLIVNARDAMPDGGILKVRTSREALSASKAAAHPEAKPGEYVALKVSDSGKGIPAAIRERVFDPFFTTKEGKGGTGLGLPTVFGIVKQSGGFLDIDSEEGQGTCVEVYLPVVEGEFDEESLKSETGIISGSENIIVVEDDASVLKTVITILKGAGYSVVGAQNGAEAIKKVALSSETFDLVVTDIVMPHIDGKELANKLLEAIPGLKVLYISGYNDNSILPSLGHPDRVDFQQKPFTAAILTRKVRELLDRE